VSKWAENEVVLPAAGSYTIKPDGWASSYKERPVCALKIGLRLLSDSDITYAKAIAKDIAERRPDDEKRALILGAVSAAICDLNNAALAHEHFQQPDEDLPRMLRAETIQAIYEELERLIISTSPLYPEASDEEIVCLMGMLDLDDIDSLEGPKSSRVRRYLRFVLDELTDAC
jgi:hypothetical protein